MRELHGRDAQEAIDTGTDSGADAAGRHAGGSRRPDRAIVQNAETRTAFALAYRERVAIEYAARDQEDAVPGDEGRRSPAATGTEGDRASRLAEHRNMASSARRQPRRASSTAEPSRSE
jgi:hypothetical protein